jgi:hypothetical protein
MAEEKSKSTTPASQTAAKEAIKAQRDAAEKAAAEKAAAEKLAAAKAAAAKAQAQAAADRAAMEKRVEAKLAADKAKVRTGTVNVQSLRIRKDHTTESVMVGGLVYGDKVNIIETWTDGKDTWAHIGPDQWAAMIYKKEIYIKED